MNESWFNLWEVLSKRRDPYKGEYKMIKENTDLCKIVGNVFEDKRLKNLLKTEINKMIQEI